MIMCVCVSAKRKQIRDNEQISEFDPLLLQFTDSSFQAEKIWKLQTKPEKIMSLLPLLSSSHSVLRSSEFDARLRLAISQRGAALNAF
jgi:hypothetical protein